MFRALIDERGPWSANPFPNNAVTHWKLDKTEDTWRRREKLRRNYHFDEKLCHPPSTAPSDEATLSVNENKSGFVGLIPEQMKRFLLKGVRRITDEGSSELNDNDTEQSGHKASIPKDPSDTQCSELKDSSDQKDVLQDRKDSSSSSPETETSEVCVTICKNLKREGGGGLPNCIAYVLIAFSGSFVSFMCTCYPKEKISWAFGSHEKCLAFLW